MFWDLLYFGWFAFLGLAVCSVVGAAIWEAGAPKRHQKRLARLERERAEAEAKAAAEAEAGEEATAEVATAEEATAEEATAEEAAAEEAVAEEVAAEAAPAAGAGDEAAEQTGVVAEISHAFQTQDQDALIDALMKTVPCGKCEIQFVARQGFSGDLSQCTVTCPGCGNNVLSLPRG
jgi:hypothetical protein